MEFTLLPEPAVSGETVKHYGPLTLEFVRGGTILQWLGKPGETLPAAPEGASLRAAGPGQAFLVFDHQLKPDEMATIAALGVPVTDQSHGRQRIRVSGTPVRHLLAKGTAVDLHPDHFAVHRSTMTLFGHIGMNLTRMGTDEFELLPLRGFAQSLWDELCHAGAEWA
jgi:sarcosine oxidase subunit gamma